MKKFTGAILAIMMISVILTGCYSKSCEQPVYKGEVERR